MKQTEWPESGPRFVHLWIAFGGTHWIRIPIHTNDLPAMIHSMEEAIKNGTWLKIPCANEEFYHSINGAEIKAWHVDEIRPDPNREYQQRLASSMEKLADQQ